MLTALILRHDNQINIASLLPEDGYTGSMATALYQTGVFWRELKEKDPDKLEAPMRVLSAHAGPSFDGLGTFRADACGPGEAGDGDQARLAQLGGEPSHGDEVGSENQETHRGPDDPGHGHQTGHGDDNGARPL